MTFASTATAGFSFKSEGFCAETDEMCTKVIEEFENEEKPNDWELLYQETDLTAYRRRIEGPYEMYEYKCVGSYHDISPRSFLDAQNDLTYRRKWDENILSLDLLESDDENELIRWVSKFPYPLYPREYVYVRRTWISDDEKYSVVESECVDPDHVPTSSTSNVRVCSYKSQMAIKAHEGWDDHGVDYILIYSDNPEANIPRYIYNWMVNKGGPYFLRQVHVAAKQIETNGTKVKSAIEGAQRAMEKRKEAKRREDERQREKEETERKRAADAQTTSPVNSTAGRMTNSSFKKEYA